MRRGLHALAGALRPDAIFHAPEDSIHPQFRAARVRRDLMSSPAGAAAARTRYGTRRLLRSARKLVHLGASPNSPANHRNRPANANTAISPNISSKITTHVDICIAAAPVVVFGRHRNSKSVPHCDAIEKNPERCKNLTRFHPAVAGAASLYRADRAAAVIGRPEGREQARRAGNARYVVTHPAVYRYRTGSQAPPAIRGCGERRLSAHSSSARGRHDDCPALPTPLGCCGPFAPAARRR